jgi:cytidylate kinase
LITALLAGDTYEQAARKVPCSLSTVKRRLADQDFAERLAVEREQLFRSAVDLLVAGTLAAGKRLMQHIADADAEVSLKACAIVVQNAVKARDRGQVSAQMAELIAQARNLAERFPTPFPGR